MDRAGWQRIEDRIFSPRWLALCSGALVAGYVLFMATGYLGGAWIRRPDGSPSPLDFLATFAAGQLTLVGQAAAAYDPQMIAQQELATIGAPPGHYPWVYPPSYLLIAAPLALLPYAASTLVWLLATLAAYLAAIRAILPSRSTMLAAAASPFALWNTFTGQNGFLTAALIGFALVNLDRRPVLAGVFLGLLTWKPHLGILFPLVLALTGRWHCFRAAAATACGLAGLAWLLFGTAAWRGFFVALHDQHGLYLESGAFAWWRFQSMFALVRLAGGGEIPAWIAHGAFALAVAAWVSWLWCQPVRYALKAAALSAAAVVMTPYLFIYDLTVLSVPVAFLVRDGMEQGFLPGERMLLAILTLALLALYSAPVGTPLALLLLLLVALRTRKTANLVASPLVAPPERP